MKENSTLIVFLLDRSGSMGKVRDDTIGGFNVFVDKQRKETKGEVKLTLIQFDNKYELNYALMPLDKVSALTQETYVPRGNTALIDSMVRAIRDTGIVLSSMSEAERPSRVIFVTVTDGEENSSKEFNSMQLREMINHQRSKYSWDFIYLGANHDAFTTAAQYGYFASSTGNWNYANTGMAYTTVADSISCAVNNNKSFKFTQDPNAPVSGTATNGGTGINVIGGSTVPVVGLTNTESKS
jgi:hypothetical protein